MNLRRSFYRIETKNNTKEIKSDKLLNNNDQLVDKTQNLDNPINNKNLKEVVNLINKELKNLDISHRVLNSTIKNLKQKMLVLIVVQ